MVEILENECSKALEEMRKKIFTSDAVDIEQKLWKSIIKVYKENSNSVLINYLIGYYLTLHELLFINTPYSDNFLKFNRYGFVLGNSNLKLLYNIHIRLGDLYRYVDSRDNAKHFYQRALHIDPRRGIAYNQLSLCTPLTKAYQCIYYSVRACNASMDPIKGAESNIKLSISRLDCPIFERFRIALNVEMNENSIKIPYPSSGQEWFYLIVISLHLNDLNLTLDLLLDEILKIIDYDLKSTNLDFLLMSLDVALDWILKDRANFDNMTSSIEILKSFNSRLKLNSNLLKQTGMEIYNIALVHNLILKDFLPLKNIYEKMQYYYEAENYRIDKHRKILISRLIYKLQNF